MTYGAYPAVRSVAESIREHFARVNATIRQVEKARLDAEPSHLESLLRFGRRSGR